MSKKDKQVKGQSEAPAAEVVAPQQTAPAAETKPEAPKQETDQVLVLGPKAPKHRVGHNSAAWAVIVPMLPAKAGELGKAVGVLPNIGGPKGNGMLYVSYAVRRGWLAKQA